MSIAFQRCRGWQPVDSVGAFCRGIGRSRAPSVGRSYRYSARSAWFDWNVRLAGPKNALPIVLQTLGRTLPQEPSRHGSRNPEPPHDEWCKSAHNRFSASSTTSIPAIGIGRARMGIAEKGAATIFRFEGELSLGGPRSALFSQDDPISQWTESGVHELGAFFGPGAPISGGGATRLAETIPKALRWVAIVDLRMKLRFRLSASAREGAVQ